MTIIDGARSPLRVLWFAALTGYADYRAIFTWRSWWFGLLPRVLSQVAFFALIGRLLGSQERTAYLLIGNAVAVAAMEAMIVVAYTTLERRAGTLPLLVASPTNQILVLAARSLHLPVTGSLSACLALFILAPIFSVPLPLPAALAAVPLILVVGLSTYAFGLVFAGLVLRAVEIRNLVSNVIFVTLTVVCGVQVPISFWPQWVQWLASVLPLTHGLASVRSLLNGAQASVVLGHAALEFLVGAAWLAVAVLALRGFAERGRRTGSLDFSD